MEVEPVGGSERKNGPLRPGAAAALEYARSAGRPVRHREFLAIGIHREDVAHLESLGRLRRVARGTYVVDEGDGAVRKHWDFLAAAALRWPTAVVCGPTAAAFHGLVPDDPSCLWIAVPRGKGRPRGMAAGREIRVREWIDSRFEKGIRKVKIDGVTVRIVNPALALSELDELSGAYARTRAD
jgi:predicted transcriptional regulator of viral defense system